MKNDPKPPTSSRENMLAIALVLLVGGMILFMLYLVSFGIIGNVIIGGGLIVMVGAIHYLAWGKAFSDEVAAEREALRRQDAREAKLTKVSPNAIQDLARTQGIKSERDA